MAAAMKSREAALDAKTAALSAAIAQLGKLLEALGKQTSQYIAMGIHQSIGRLQPTHGDAVKGPLAELNIAAHHAQNVMRAVGGFKVQVQHS